jgi:hypothetical protein
MDPYAGILLEFQYSTVQGTGERTPGFPSFLAGEPCFLSGTLLFAYQLLWLVRARRRRDTLDCARQVSARGVLRLPQSTLPRSSSHALASRPGGSLRLLNLLGF